MKDFWLDTTADAWFDASHQGKEHDFLTEFQRNFAFNMGIISRACSRPSDKQYPIAENIWNLYLQYLSDEEKKGKKK
jgi:hypothetical protein